MKHTPEVSVLSGSGYGKCLAGAGQLPLPVCPPMSASSTFVSGCRCRILSWWNCT